MEVEKGRLLPADSPTVAIDFILWIRRYGVYLLLAVALLVLAVELYNFWRVSKMRKLEEAWVALQSASSPGAIQESVLTVYHDPRVAAQAYLKIGRLYLLRLTLGSGVNKTLGLKATRAQAIAGAKLAFEKVIQRYPKPVINKLSALLGLALVYEDAHEWKKAAKIYQSIIHSKQNSTTAAFTALAKFRLHNLKHWAEPILAGPDLKFSSAASQPTKGPQSGKGLPASKPDAAGK